MKYYLFRLLISSALVLATQQLSATESKTNRAYFQKVVKTAKERLGEKASDRQRVNNCKVPIEKRGAKPRPDQCH